MDRAQPVCFGEMVLKTDYDELYQSFEQLKEQNAELIKVARFYADPRNIENGADDESWRGRVVFGKLARQTLKELGVV